MYVRPRHPEMSSGGWQPAVVNAGDSPLVFGCSGSPRVFKTPMRGFKSHRRQGNDALSQPFFGFGEVRGLASTGAWLTERPPSATFRDHEDLL